MIAVQLVALHKVLIGFAIALGAVLMLVSVVLFRRSGDPAQLVPGAVGLAASVALAFYLRWFVAKRARTLSAADSGKSKS